MEGIICPKELIPNLKNLISYLISKTLEAKKAEISKSEAEEMRRKAYSKMYNAEEERRAGYYQFTNLNERSARWTSILKLKPVRLQNPEDPNKAWGFAYGDLVVFGSTIENASIMFDLAMKEDRGNYKKPAVTEGEESDA